MPRKAFVADLQDVVREFIRNNISELKAGEEDGMISFQYQVNDGSATEVTILVLGK